MKKLLSLMMLVLTMSVEGADVNHANGEKAFYKEFANLKWEKLIPGTGADAPDKSVLHINPKTGATQLIVKCAKNTHVPNHWHTANESICVIEGSFTMHHDGMDGKTALTKGSFGYMPSKLPHEAWVGPEECILYVMVDGPWDLHLIESK